MTIMTVTLFEQDITDARTRVVPSGRRTAIGTDSSASMDTTVVFVSAQQGPRVLQKSTLQLTPAEHSLVTVGASIVPDGELLRVEGSACLGGEAATFAGDMLQQTVGFVVTKARLQFLKFCFASDHSASVRSTASADGETPRKSVIAAMMEDKRRRAAYYWPEMYVEDSNKSSVRQIANGIIAAGRADTVRFGGFPSEEIASEARSQIWALAQVLYAVVPRATAWFLEANRG
jgi:hypothetical protein